MSFNTCVPEIDWKRVDILIDLALSEDLDERGDTTTNSVIPADLEAEADPLWRLCCFFADLLLPISAGNGSQ